MDYKKAYRLLDDIFAPGKEIVFKRRETIVGYNQDSSYVCRVVEGCVKVFSYTCSGSERIHFLYTNGDVFPMSCFMQGVSEEIGFMALTDVRLISRSIEDVMKGFDSKPYALLALLEQQAGMYGRIVNLNLGSSEQRLAHWLISLGTRFGIRSGDHYIVSLPLTIQEIADMVRLTRETTGKTLSQFEQRGLIIFGRQQILVYPDRLQKVVDLRTAAAVATA